MTGIIATLLADTSIFPADDGDRGPHRHVRDDLERLMAQGDPPLEAPYLAASAVSTLGANGCTSGNFTLTINFPKYNVAVTTANIAYNAAQAAIQSAIDTAMSGSTVITAYSNGHINAGTCANLSSASCALTANGASVNGAHMVVTATDVNLDLAPSPVTATTIGTPNRPAEAFLNAYNVVVPRDGATPVAHGASAEPSDYVRGDNDAGLPPATLARVVDACILSEDRSVGSAVASRIPTVSSPTIAANVYAVIPPSIALSVQAANAITAAETLRTNAVADGMSVAADLVTFDSDLAAAIETYNTWNGTPNASVQALLDTANNASIYTTAAVSQGDSAMATGNTTLSYTTLDLAYQRYVDAITHANNAADFFGDISNTGSAHWCYDNAADYLDTGIVAVADANAIMSP